MMNKKFSKIAGSIILLSSLGSALYAEAAPDGMTRASDTKEASNGKWEKWLESWKSISTDWTQSMIEPGSNETELNFSWYSNGGDLNFFYGKKKDLSDAVSVTPETVDTQYKAYRSCRVTLSGLAKNTVYYYRIGEREIQSFKTQDSGSFSFIFVGDPQIGSSNENKTDKDIIANKKGKYTEDEVAEAGKRYLLSQYEAVANDSFNWNNTLVQALKKTSGKAAFILSAGDQIQTKAKDLKNLGGEWKGCNEIEYAGFLSPEALKSIPLATTVGNHDVDGNYKAHFNVPNASSLADDDKGAGGDYWFRYGNALFIMLNTQNLNIAEHKQFVEETVDANTDCVWKIVTLHQDIYGSAEHSNEPEIVNLRYSLVPIFEENKIDVVLTGHDHAYSRSQLMHSGEVKAIKYDGMDFSGDDKDKISEMFGDSLEKDISVENPARLFVAPSNIKADSKDSADRAYLDYLESVMDKEAVKAVNGNKIVNPEGILYMTANSSSGSKYYDLVPRMQSFIAARWQEDVPTYSVIEIKGNTFTINTYRTDSNAKIDKSISLIKK